MQIKQIKTTVSLTEASGVVRKGNELFIVSDAAPSAYYSLKVKGDQGPLIHLSPQKVLRHELANAALAIDFEAVDILADGRVVALSERLRSLIGANGVIIQYDDPLSELGERGLEGLAVRAVNEDASEVAVLWEGGWVEDSEVQPQIRQLIVDPLLPVVIIHQIMRDATGMKAVIENDLDFVELKVPQPDQDKDGWRFRAPDLVWHQWHGESKPGFIVLLNSQRLAELPGKPKYGPRWLQRFDCTGNPVGSHLDLDEEANKLLGDDSLQDANWEGLGWYETGKRLVLVHDTPNKIDDIPVALVVDLPSSWS